MYCRKCGNELGYKDKFCGVCGEPSNIATNTTTTVTYTKSKEDWEKVLFAVLGAFVPIIGLIVSLLVRKDKPEAAKIGIIVSCARLFMTFLSIFFALIEGLF